MQIIMLGPYRENLVKFIESNDDDVIVINEPLKTNQRLNADFLISYGYRYIIKNEILLQFSNRAINMHISLLPWNRGADPNIWSFLEDTLKGVTIHYLTEKIDKGDILVQREVEYSMEDTLRTTYDRLSYTIELLFMEYWLSIRDCKIKAEPQTNEGSYHCISDLDEYKYLLNNGWDTPVKNIIGKAKK